MIVVSDTSAISALIQVGRDALLQELFSTVIIPRAVQGELLRCHQDLPSFLEVVDVNRPDFVVELCSKIDLGEAEAIILAHELSADVLLIDDWAAREIAIARGLPVTGLIGVLAEAKRNKLISSLREVIEDLDSIAGFWMSTRLKVSALRSVGE
jgi:predicted nucleic acid-binding protein